MAPRSRAARRIAAALVAAPLIMPFAAAVPANAVPAQAGNNVEATIDNKFTPATLTVPAGTTVTWTNAPGGFHTVTGGADVVDPASPIGDNMLDASNPTVQILFATEGTFPYYCKPHVSMGMRGTIVVTAAGAGPAAGSGSPAASGSATAAAGSVAPSGSGEATNTGAAQSQTASAAAVAAGSGAPDENLGGPAAKSLDDKLSDEAKPLTTFRLALWALTLGIVLLGAAVYFDTKPPRDAA